MCNRRQNPEFRIRSSCDDPAYPEWFSLWWPGTLPTSPKSSRIQNSESEDRPPRPKIGLDMWWPDIPPARAEFRIQVLAFASCGFCPEFKERGAEFIIKNQEWLVGGNGEQRSDPESRIMTGGWWIRERDENPEFRSRQGSERLCIKQKRIQNSELWVQRDLWVREIRAESAIRGDCRIIHNSGIDNHSHFYVYSRGRGRKGSIT